MRDPPVTFNVLDYHEGCLLSAMALSGIVGYHERVIPRVSGNKKRVVNRRSKMLRKPSRLGMLTLQLALRIVNVDVIVGLRGRTRVHPRAVTVNVIAMTSRQRTNNTPVLTNTNLRSINLHWEHGLLNISPITQIPRIQVGMNVPLILRKSQNFKVETRNQK